MTSKIPDGDFLLIVDVSSYVHRAYHAAPRTVRRADGQPTGAIISLCWTFLKLFRLNKTALGRRPSHAVIVMDARGKNFRHEIYPAYKANRPPYDPDLEVQLPFIPRVAEAFSIPCVVPVGYEADDLIATYATRGVAEGLNVVIASADKDFCQLVSDRVFLYDAMKDRDDDRSRGYDTSHAIIDIDAVKAKWGVFPWQFLDCQALMGDVVDGIPGVRGIGPKTAAALIKKFDNLDAMLEEADWGAEQFKPAEYERIIDSLEEIRLSRELAELKRDVPLELEVDDLYLSPIDSRALKAFLESLEAPQMARRCDF